MAHITKNGEYQLLLDEIATEFDDFKIIKKSDSKLMKVINVLLRVITFNQIKTFMTSFTTTLGNVIYVPTKWEGSSLTARWLILNHERVHMQQAKKYGRFLFSVLYLLVLPGLFAFYRTKFEKEAYEASLRCQLYIYGPESLTNEHNKKHMVDHFTTHQYFWMWINRSSIEQWYDETVNKILEYEGYEI